MRRKKNKSFKKRLAKKLMRGQILIGLIVVIVAVGAFLIAGGLKYKKPKVSDAPTYSSNDIVTPVASQQNNLQLKTFVFSKPCPHENGQQVDASCSCKSATGEWKILCINKKCVTASGNDGPTVQCSTLVNDNPAPTPDGYTQLSDLCANPHYAPTDGIFCVAKPVIYLYPTEKTFVDVSVITPGKISVSDPIYPTDGWKNVEANPDGTLFYNNKTYKELFYESEVSTLTKPTNGIIIAKSKLEEKLNGALDELGLIAPEKKEFLDFWIPRLENLNSNYILFSILDKNAKNAVDNIIISPEPETRIEFIAYFKPIKTPINVVPLVLPPKPQRVGFTEVEWGGTIDK